MIDTIKIKELADRASQLGAELMKLYVESLGVPTGPASVQPIGEQDFVEQQPATLPPPAPAPQAHAPNPYPAASSGNNAPAQSYMPASPQSASAPYAQPQQQSYAPQQGWQQRSGGRQGGQGRQYDDWKPDANQQTQEMNYINSMPDFPDPNGFIIPVGKHRGVSLGQLMADGKKSSIAWYAYNMWATKKNGTFDTNVAAFKKAALQICQLNNIQPFNH